jgi:metal-responsive CopG/Arc/MetJ family transcriptional regulator
MDPSDKKDERFTVVVSEEQLKRIDRHAKKEGRKRSNFARHVLMNEIDRREQESEKIPA